MTQPNEYFPEKATNFGSFATYAQTTEDEWEDEMRGRSTNPFLAVFGGLFDGLQEGVSFVLSLVSKIVSTILNLDPTTIFLNVVSALSDLGNWALNAVIGGIKGIINGIVKGITGLIDFFTQDDATEALSDLSGQVAILTGAIYDAEVPDFKVDFTTYGDSPNLGVLFNTTYSGGGDGTLGTLNGRTRWYASTNRQSRLAICRYNAAVTTGDDQIVGAVYSASPERSGSSEGRAWLIGRCNATEDTFVYATMDYDTITLGCYVGGIQTQFASASVRFKTNTSYALRCGKPGDPRYFELLRAGIPILTYDEIGTTSQLGGTFRSGGFGGYASEGTGFGGAAFCMRPGGISYWFMNNA